MAVILNIETSSSTCSVALTEDGAVTFQLEDTEGMKHAEKLAPFAERAMEELKRKERELDAVAVSIGPGSYTGLRIGLSLAKGLSFGLGIPLIGVPTLKILAVKAMFRSFDWTGEELLIPMMDARRMEVFTAVYDMALNEVMKAGPLILGPDSYSGLPEGRPVWVMGDCIGKARGVVDLPGAHWLPAMSPHAIDMTALSEKAFREGDFIDVAYSTPLYLKEYQATVPRPRI